MKNKNQKENWEKELLKLKISDWTSDNGIPVEIWNFIEELLKSEREKWLEKIEEIIDDNNDLLIRWQKEELKDEIKKRIKGRRK